MKKHFFKNISLLLLLALISVSVFAQKPALNEGFETFNIGSSSKSGMVWLPRSGDISVQVAVNPSKSGINKSDKVLKIERFENPTITVENGNEFTWRGATSASYDLSKGNTCGIEFKVLKNAAGKISIRFYVDDNKKFVELVSDEMPASSEWQLVKFDLTGKIVDPITPKAYLLIQPEKNSSDISSQANALSVYVDDIQLVENK